MPWNLLKLSPQREYAMGSHCIFKATVTKNIRLTQSTLNLLLELTMKKVKDILVQENRFEQKKVIH